MPDSATPASSPPSLGLSPELLASLTDTAATLARSVGQVIRSLRAAGVDVAATKSSINDVVTAADREAERLLIAGLRELRPDDGILGEEGASITGTTGITWVVDPIDGTVNYLYDLPAYAVSIAATIADGAPGTMEDGRRAVAGAVYLPVTDHLFTARAGGGAALNGARLGEPPLGEAPLGEAPLGGDPTPGPQETSLATALVATGFGYTVERRTEQAEVVSRLIPRVRDIRRMGSAATDLCLVAAGRLDAYYERGLQPWDYAAGALIAREAGALVLGRGGAPAGEAMLVAAAPGLAHELLDAIESAYADAGR